MPREPSSASRSITVLAVTLTLDDLPSQARCGTSLHFTGRLLFDTTPAVMQEIDIYRVDSAGNIIEAVTGGLTESDGYFDFTWPVSYGLGCTTQYFRAYHMDSDVWSGIKSTKVTFRTFISSFTAPSSVGVGIKFTASGYLTYESASGVTTTPLSGKTITIGYDGKVIGTTTTDANGLFEKTDCSIPERSPAGAPFTLKAEFAGEGLALAGAVATIKIGVASIVDRWKALSTWQKAGLAISIIGTIIGAVAVAKRKR